MGPTKVEGRFFSRQIYMSLKTKWCMRPFYQMPLMPTWESCPPQNLKSDLPVAAELVISPHREIHPGFCAGSVIMAQKKWAGWKNFPAKKMSDIAMFPCSHMFPWKPPMGLYLNTTPRASRPFLDPSSLCASRAPGREWSFWGQWTNDYGIIRQH